MDRRLPLFAALTAALLAPGPAGAHTVLTAPTPRWTGFEGSALKERPCGWGAAEGRSETVTTLYAGDTLTVSWEETIPHPGYFRISFDDDGWDFVDPPSPRATGYSDLVLVDVLYPSTPAEAAQRWGEQNLYQTTITLPEVSCERCTLQLIQFMEDKLDDGYAGNDIYYSCADLVLVPREAPADAATGDDGPGDEAPGETGTTDVPGTEPDAGTVPDTVPLPDDATLPDAATADLPASTDTSTAGNEGSAGCAAAVPASPAALALPALLALAALAARRNRRPLP
jgi:hypothetical protein